MVCQAQTARPINRAWLGLMQGRCKISILWILFQEAFVIVLLSCLWPEIFAEK